MLALANLTAFRLFAWTSLPFFPAFMAAGLTEACAVQTKFSHFWLRFSRKRPIFSVRTNAGITMSIEDTGTFPSFPEDGSVRTTKKNTGTAPGIGHNSQAKTAKERAKEHYDRKKAAGWRKTWVDPETLKLAEELGGIDKIAEEHRGALRAYGDAQAELDKLKARGFWSRLLNRKE